MCLQDDEKDTLFFFEKYKMLLATSSSLSNLTVTAANGGTLPALTVFAESLRFLREQAHRRITAACNVSNEEMMWIVTVPAIWSDAAKQFMRKGQNSTAQQRRGRSRAGEAPCSDVWLTCAFSTLLFVFSCSC
jgi:hypothetical protein